VRVIVTGGAGFIGSHLVERLLGGGHEVACLDNFDAYYDPGLKRENLLPALASPRFRLVEGDIRDAGALEQALATGGEALVHLAARPGVRPSLEQPEVYARINVEGTISVLEGARRHGIRRVVFASSSSVYGRSPDIPFREDGSRLLPASPYGASKLAAEHFCEVFHHLSRVPVTCLRFFTVYGPRQRPDMAVHRFTRLIEDGIPIPVYGDGTMRRDYTYVDDVVDGIVRAIDRADGYSVYNLGNAETVTLAELVAALERALGKSAAIEHRPPPPGDVPVTCASIERSAAQLGYAPRVKIEEGVRRFVEWFRARRAAAHRPNPEPAGAGEV